MKSVGTPLVRVDGLLKVTGTAGYTADIPLDDLAYAVLLQATIACGRIVDTDTDTAAAEAAPGVLLVLTHRDTQKLPAPKAFSGGGGHQTVPALQDDRGEGEAVQGEGPVAGLGLDVLVDRFVSIGCSLRLKPVAMRCRVGSRAPEGSRARGSAGGSRQTTESHLGRPPSTEPFDAR
jgi:hypothetical protein